MTKPEASWPHAHRTRTAPERRREKRLLCSDLMQIRWSAPSGARRSEVGIVEDFSSGGASLFLGVPVPPLTGVALDADTRTFHGVVRHCASHPNGYVVGVEFDRECHREEYRPEHLLDVTELDFTSEEDER